jgi:hypothetical protein
MPVALDYLITDSVYESRDKSRPLMPEDREFMFWDGEGVNSATKPGKHNYVLFGHSNGEYITDTELHTKQLLAFIIQQGKLYPNRFHVAFAFDYDVNMILRHMTPQQFETLKRRNAVRYGNYRIEHIPHKWFQVTEYGSAYPSDRRDRTTVRIADMFGFFQCSFLKAIRSYLGGNTDNPDPILQEISVIERGKERRSSFTYSEINDILSYWRVEGSAGLALAEKLREYLYDVGLTVAQWHGPGVLANWAYRKHNIKLQKRECDPAVYDAARFAYAGGRFERYQIGRFREGFGLDINSAYPYAISQLPSLSEGTWHHRTAGITPWNIVEFGVYHVRMRGPIVSSTPAPLFHRDRAGNISYPWLTDGWYWSPEVATLRGMSNVEILEGWEYIGWETRPFAFVKGIYTQRRELKRLGIGSEKALKLLLTSLYGKMSQRVGWQRTGGPPTWHQLEWAGWVTSATRAKLFSVIRRIPLSELIAVETDGIYTSCHPKQLGITHSDELGGWEVSPFEEIRYVQSGMYAKGADGKWETKYRGLDAESINAWTIRKHLQALLPGGQPWPTLSGPTTRFVGYRQALWREEQNMGPMKMHLCRWEKDTKDLSAGSAGKRVHTARLCAACSLNATAWEMPHGTVIRSNAVFGIESHRHDIPWLDHEKRAWREYEEYMTA